MNLHNERDLNTGRGDNYANYKISNRTISQTLTTSSRITTEDAVSYKNVFSAHVQYHSSFFAKYNSGCTIFLTKL
jgi:hypothetical protein